MIAKSRVEQYISEHQLADRSKPIYRRTLDRYMAEIKPGSDGWEGRSVSWITDRKCGAAGKSLYTTIVKTFLNWCVRQNFIKSNPMVDMKIRRGVPKSRRALTDDEVESLLKIEPNTESAGGEERAARDVAAITLMLYTGVRVAGICSMNVEDFSVEQGVQTARYLSKGHIEKDLTAVLQDEVIEKIEVYLKATRRTWASEGPLFLGPRGRISLGALEAAVKARLRAAGIDLCVHCLRHTAASAALKAGADVMQIRDMLGHSNIATTQIYLHSLDRIEHAAETKIRYVRKGGKK